MTESATISDQQQMLDHLRAAAGAAASWDVVRRPETTGAFPARIRAAQHSLKLLERDLASLPIEDAEGRDNHVTSRNSALLELRENFRLLRSAVAGVSDNPRLVVELPRVILNAHQDEPRAATSAEIYLKAVDGDFSPLTFRMFIRELQVHEPLDVGELWSITNFLEFALLESLLVEARNLLDSSADLDHLPISCRIRSLRLVSRADWVSIIEPLIAFDATLRQDPAQVYASMDFESREYYRSRVAFVARHSDCGESMVAHTAIELAKEAVHLRSDDPRIHQRRVHVGYYLVDKGLTQLAARTGFHPPLIDRIRMLTRSAADDFYLVGIALITIFGIAGMLFPLLSTSSTTALVIAVALILLPVTQVAVELVNNTVTAIFGPQTLSKLDFSKSIPVEFATLVAVPTLLLNEQQVRKMVVDLEVRFLANRDPNLHFALLSDLPDSISKPRDHDTHPLVELAVQLIDELNAKYASPKNGSFLLLHRHRIYNTRQGVWMGWERKRGKLLDLNKLLVGTFDAFPIKAGPLKVLSPVRYVLTLDSDTQLPRGTAARLIGAIAHPLNQAVIDPKLHIVTSGYGILQPRIGITVQSASRSRLATIYSGQSGFDIYTRSVSDAYQDLFGEGSFTGKGIYEVATFHSVLDGRFPRNALLSHDLIEGAYTRAGLATDVELIDDYPSHYSAYIHRKHRWVRGDWQIVQWMFPRVPEESGHWVNNPISIISRWKIFDNLRRSLVEPFTFILFVAGWLGMAGGPRYWTVVSLLMLIFPSFVALGFSLAGALRSDTKDGFGDAFSGFGKGLFIALLNLVFLPHQTLLAIDAIVRSLVRRFITGKRLLEWETAAQSESRSSNRTPVDRYLAFVPFISLGLGILIYFNSPQTNAISYAAPILMVWAFSHTVTVWLNRSPSDIPKSIGRAEEDFLLSNALRIWRYFHQFGGENHNHLIPDNVEEEGTFEAARVSPTNLGLLLNARQAACQFGFLTAPEFVDLTNRTLATIEKLEKHRGHLYNWYDTQSLAPLAPLTISSVDSGNFVASLYTLRGGALALGRQPVLSPQLFKGLVTHWQLLRTKGDRSAQLAQIPLPSPNASVAEWIDWLPAASAALSASSATLTADQLDHWWIAETAHRMSAILTLLDNYTPWLLAKYRPLGALPGLDLVRKEEVPSINASAAFSEEFCARLASALVTLEDNSPLLVLGKQLRATLPEATRKLRALASELLTVAKHAERVADATEFSFLVDPDRRMLSVGYDVAAQRLHPACYDLLASEARIAAFLSVARGDLPQQSWLNLGRGHTRTFSHFILLSWTGTMFEYLMPSLWMRSYPDTLIARTLRSCVQVQRAFARSLNIPWGISESGFSRQDDAGHYQYHAFGIPETALKIDADAGPTVSPYSSFLALGVDSVEALRNLHRMADAGWEGDYGFYEAADFSHSLEKPVIVREWMAHHQGMSLLAVLNLLHGNIVQRWFHANPLVRSSELLLNELPVRQAVLRAKARNSNNIKIAVSKAV